MIWQCETGVIVMLTREMEGGKNKCFRYWPDATSRTELTFGKYRVVLAETFNSEDGVYCTRKIELLANFSQEVDSRSPSHVALIYCQVREILQFCFYAWPDHGAPQNTKDLLDFYWLAKVRWHVWCACFLLCVHRAPFSSRRCKAQPSSTAVLVWGEAAPSLPSIGSLNADSMCVF